MLIAWKYQSMNTASSYSLACRIIEHNAFWKLSHSDNISSSVSQSVGHGALNALSKLTVDAIIVWRIRYKQFSFLSLRFFAAFRNLGNLEWIWSEFRVNPFFTQKISAFLKFSTRKRVICFESHDVLLFWLSLDIEDLVCWISFLNLS